MQVFQRHRSVLGGMDEAIAVLRECSGRRGADGAWVPGWDELEVHALLDGDEIEPWETVMTIEGDYSLFCHLETVYLGVLARRTLISRNVREVVEAAHGKPILYFPARHDHHRVQTGDGYAAHIAGAIGVSTDAQASWWGGRGIGTVPHGLIAAYGGDTVLAAQRFAETLAPRWTSIVLVDFENDSRAAPPSRSPRALGAAALGRAARHLLDDGRPLAVARDGPLRPARRQPAARRARSARRSTARARPDVRIVVSGGFTVAKIRAFEAAGVPGRRLRRRLGADSRRERLHRRRRRAATACRPPRPAAASCPNPRLTRVSDRSQDRPRDCRRMEHATSRRSSAPRSMPRATSCARSSSHGCRCSC